MYVCLCELLNFYIQYLNDSVRVGLFIVMNLMQKTRMNGNNSIRVGVKLTDRTKRLKVSERWPRPYILRKFNYSMVP